MMYLVCHVTSHDHLIERAYKFMGGSSLGYVTGLISLVLVTMSNVVVEISCYLICHVTSHEHMLKELSEFMGRSLLRCITILLRLVAIGL